MAQYAIARCTTPVPHHNSISATAPICFSGKGARRTTKTFYRRKLRAQAQSCGQCSLLVDSLFMPAGLGYQVWEVRAALVRHHDAGVGPPRTTERLRRAAACALAMASAVDGAVDVPDFALIHEVERHGCTFRVSRNDWKSASVKNSRLRCSWQHPACRTCRQNSRSLIKWQPIRALPSGRICAFCPSFTPGRSIPDGSDVVGHQLM